MKTKLPWILTILLAIALGVVLIARPSVKQAPASQAEKKILYWVDPMHPAYKSDKPGIAPDCGMKLEPVYADGQAASDTRDASLLNVSPEQQRLIGVEYGQAELVSASNSFRAVGKIAQDETRVVRVHSKIEGWIEQVFLDFTGAQVEKGQK